ncbi:MAG: S41 family peptidase [Planctomycetota bacterium]
MPSRNLNVILFAIVVGLLCHVVHRRTRTAAIISEAIELIDQHYVDEVDPQKLIEGAMKGVVGELDQHSSFFAVEQYETFQDSIHQEFAGIGIYVRQAEEGKPVRVVTPLVRSPALVAGIMPNDEIIQVDGQDVSQMKLDDVSDRLKGPPGTTVDIVVRRGEDELPLSVKRARIELESVVGDHRNEDHDWVYRLREHPEVAYIRMKSFGEKTVNELESVLVELDNNFSALVLDLRGNGGGLLYAAGDVCDMFLSSGDIVSTRVRGGRIDEFLKATPGTLVHENIPMAILVDGNSASASEIVAACLQDNDRATVVGMRSFGKGTVQEIIPLEYGKRALRLTIAKYYRPNNENIHRGPDATEDDQWGVTPDEGFTVPMDLDALRKLSRAWDVASYPALEGIDVPEPETETGEEPIEDAIEAVELDSMAEKNVARGPSDLEMDPPLRAAVGHLLEHESPGESASEPEPEAVLDAARPNSNACPTDYAGDHDALSGVSTGRRKSVCRI